MLSPPHGRGLYVGVTVVSPLWELQRAGWGKSALAQLHKRAFYCANQSGSPRLGPLPRKHSLEGVSPYPCALAERRQYYHCTALTLSPLLSLLLPPAPALSTPVVPAIHRQHHHSFFFSSRLSSKVPLMLCYSVHTLQPSRLPSGGCDLQRNVIMSPVIGCVPLKSVMTVSYYIVYLPEGSGSQNLTIFKSSRSGATTSPCIAPLGRYVTRFVMSTVIPARIAPRTRSRWRKLSWDVEMFMTRHKQGPALKHPH